MSAYVIHVGAPSPLRYLLRPAKFDCTTLTIVMVLHEATQIDPFSMSQNGSVLVQQATAYRQHHDHR